MKKRYWIILGALLAVAASTGVITKLDHRTVDFAGSKLSFDPNSSLTNEDGLWGISGTGLKTLAKQAGGDGSALTNVSGGGAQVWTNDGSITYPLQYGTFSWGVTEAGAFTNSGLGPQVTIFTNGSIGIGRTSIQDFNPFFPNNPARYLTSTTMQDSNEPPVLFLELDAINNENYDFSSVAALTAKVDDTSPESELALVSEGTNANTTSITIDGAATGSFFTGPVWPLTVRTNFSTIIAGVDWSGIWTGTKYTISGTTNQIIFGATNTTPTGSATTPTKWVSVQVQGESVVYRLPLYQ